MPKKGEKKVKKEETHEIIAVEVHELPAVQAKENNSVEGFITQAIAQNVSVETMERLLAMRTQLKTEHAKEAFIAAMGRFQAECPIIVKDKIVYEKNSTRVRYKYAPMDSIINQVREFIGKNGLSYTIDVENKDGLLTAICKITHILGHSETSSFQVPIDQQSFMSAPQKYAAASTFAKRYALTNALGILTGDEDNDANDMDDAPAAPPAPKPLRSGYVRRGSPPPAPAPTAPLESDNPVFASYKKRLKEVKSLDELKTVWSDIPVAAKKALEDVKDDMKAILNTEADV